MRSRFNTYSHDETIGLSHRPEVVVKTTSLEEIGEVLRLANLENVPVTPRGKGTGLSGGAVPFYGGIVLSCEKMERIIDIDHENLMVITEPGNHHRRVAESRRSRRPLLSP